MRAATKVSRAEERRAIGILVAENTRVVVRPRRRCSFAHFLEQALPEVEVVASDAAGDADWPGLRPRGLAGAVRLDLEAVLGPSEAAH